MALDIFKEFATDTCKEEEGTWVGIGGGAELLLARAGNKAYGKMLAKEYEKHKRELELKNETSDKLSEDIMIDVLAKTVLLGWKGIEFQGKPLDYSVANAKLLLGLKDFRKLVGSYADDSARYRVEMEEAVAKN